MKKTYTTPDIQIVRVEHQHLIAATKMGVNNDNSKAVNNPDYVLGRSGASWADDE